MDLISVILEQKYIDCKQDYTGKGFDQIQNVLHLIKNDPS